MKKDRKKIRLKRKMRSYKTIQLDPMMPRKYNRVQRQKLREKEKEILKGKTLTLNL